MCAVDRPYSHACRRVRTYQITVSGLSNLGQPVLSFERMFEGITVALNPGNFSAS
jgi:hypothetical protein